MFNHLPHTAIILRSSLSAITESELVTLLKRRERNGFTLLYHRYAGNLYGIVRHMVHSPEVAEDILQEAFVKIWVNIDAYNEVKGTLFTWLLNITRRTAIDHLRSQKRQWIHQHLESDITAVDRCVFQEPATDAIGLDRLLSALPFDHQLLIDHFYFKGCTQEQVAQAFGLPLGTVKTRLRAAIQHLRTAAAEPAPGKTA